MGRNKGVLLAAMSVLLVCMVVYATGSFSFPADGAAFSVSPTFTGAGTSGQVYSIAICDQVAVAPADINAFLADTNNNCTTGDVTADASGVWTYASSLGTGAYSAFVLSCAATPPVVAIDNQYIPNGNFDIDFSITESDGTTPLMSGDDVRLTILSDTGAVLYDATFNYGDDISSASPKTDHAGNWSTLATYLGAGTATDGGVVRFNKKSRATNEGYLGVGDAMDVTWRIRSLDTSTALQSNVDETVLDQVYILVFDNTHNESRGSTGAGPLVLSGPTQFVNGYRNGYPSETSGLGFWTNQGSTCGGSKEPPANVTVASAVIDGVTTVFNQAISGFHNNGGASVGSVIPGTWSRSTSLFANCSGRVVAYARAEVPSSDGITTSFRVESGANYIVYVVHELGNLRY